MQTWLHLHNFISSFVHNNVTTNEDFVKLRTYTKQILLPCSNTTSVHVRGIEILPFNFPPTVYLENVHRHSETKKLHNNNFTLL